MRQIGLIFVLLLAACGGPAPEPTAVPTPTPTPREIVISIGQATQAAQSLHFAIELTGKPVKADTSGLFNLNSMEGDLKRPDGVLAVLQLSGAAGVAEIRSVSLAGKQYITNPITRQWACLPPGVALDPVVDRAFRRPESRPGLGEANRARLRRTNACQRQLRAA